MRIVLADDSALLREGLTRTLREHELDVVGAAADKDELLRLVEQLEPDVALVDIKMPPTFTDEGLLAAEHIRAHHPGVGVLVLSQYADSDYALRLLDTNADRCGYLLKDRVTDTRALVTAIRRVGAGELVVDRELVDALVARVRGAGPLGALTDREREVLALVAEGLTDRGIATRLWLTPRTVESHVRHIFQKLELADDPASNRRVKAAILYLRA